MHLSILQKHVARMEGSDIAVADDVANALKAVADA